MATLRTFLFHNERSGTVTGQIDLEANIFVMLTCHFSLAVQAGRPTTVLPTKATARPARRAQQPPGPACDPEAASSREFDCAALSTDRGQYQTTSGLYARTLGPTSFGHRPTHPAIVRPGVKHRLAQCCGASGHLGGSWQPEAGLSDHHHKRIGWVHQTRAILVTSHTKLT